MTSTDNHHDHGLLGTKVTGAQPVANICANGSCPTVYQTDRNSVVVQGYAVPVDMDLPEGMTVVEIPIDLVKEALGNI